MGRIEHNQGSNPLEGHRRSPKKNVPPDVQAIVQDSATPSSSSASCDSFKRARREEPPPLLLPGLPMDMLFHTMAKLKALPVHKELYTLKALRATSRALKKSVDAHGRCAFLRQVEAEINKIWSILKPLGPEACLAGMPFDWIKPAIGLSW